MPKDSQASAPSQSCQICRGLGYYRVNVPVGDPRFGKAILCSCRKEDIARRHVEALRETSNLQHLADMTFDSFVIDSNRASEVAMSLSMARNEALAFAQQPSGWLVFTGSYGSGKTHLAAAIANYRLSQGHPVLFVVVPDLLDYLRATYAPNSPSTYDERFDKVRNVPMLILDDLGTQNTTPWAAEKLYQLLNYRYNAALPTVITTNQSIDDLDPRLASRLRDHQLVATIPLYGTDKRLGGTTDYFGSLGAYQNMTLESFQERPNELDAVQQASLRQALAAARRYAEQPTNWLLIRGTYGSGKTHLAAAVANRVAHGGKSVLFVVAADLLDYLRATFQPGSAVSYDQRFNEIRRAWLLVLDDLSTQNASPWAREKLVQILNYRYVSGSATVLTISHSDWESLDERLRSRLEDTTVCTTLDLDLPSFRGSRKPKQPVRRSTRRREI